jgi:hypothetical protein
MTSCHRHIRLELRSLVSFMGVYGATPHVGIEIANLTLPLNFCLVFIGDPIDGKFRMKLELRSPDGKKIEATTLPETNEQTYSSKTGSAFAFRVTATFPHPDTYTVVVSANGDEFFKDTFVIIQAKAATVSSTATSSITN